VGGWSNIQPRHRLPSGQRARYFAHILFCPPEHHRPPLSRRGFCLLATLKAQMVGLAFIRARCAHSSRIHRDDHVAQSRNNRCGPEPAVRGLQPSGAQQPSREGSNDYRSPLSPKPATQIKPVRAFLDVLSAKHSTIRPDPDAEPRRVALRVEHQYQTKANPGTGGP